MTEHLTDHTASFPATMLGAVWMCVNEGRELRVVTSFEINGNVVDALFGEPFEGRESRLRDGRS
jgi:hypothetical protein